MLLNTEGGNYDWDCPEFFAEFARPVPVNIQD